MTDTRERTLEGKIALVTGGSRGIGRAIALELARRGTAVAFNYFRNHDAARTTESMISELGARCLRVRAHLGDGAAIDRLFESVAAEFGSLDILVNNAASGVMRTPGELEPKHWDWTMNINAKAPWLCARSAAALMPRGGRIVNISSPGASRVFPDYFAVGVSKAALEAMTRYLAIDLAPQKIAVNAVSASFVMTGALEAFQDSGDVRELASRPTPAGRPVTPEDVAHAVAWLCGDDAEMVRGHVLVVDGGEMLLYR